MTRVKKIIFGGLSVAAVAAAGYFATPHRTGPADIYPPPSVRGIANPSITQATIGDTICNPDWTTDSIRPSSSYTTNWKKEQIAIYHMADSDPSHYEEDHLISLILGGDPKDISNLWPQPYTASIPDGGARFKDKVENYLHRQVCDGSITLAEAQREIVEDWYAVYLRMQSSYGSLDLDDTDLDDE